MYGIAEPVSRLIDEFVKLPGVGPKTAQRLAYFVLRLPEEEARRLAEAIVQVKERVVLCNVCFNVTERNPCALCANPARDHGKICVVEEPLDVTALERTGIYRGLYHVLHGALSPQDGIGPDDLNVERLLARLRPGQELILALNATVEGQTTAHYLADRLAGRDVRITRLAQGVPIGGELDYLDDGTLTAALKARRAVSGD